MKWYAPRLDVIRFAAFALVFVGHNGAQSDFISISRKSYMAPLEIFGVIVFFVLSAYLIGRLLLIERERTGTVSLSRYWARRILRIWPLYFTLVIGMYAAVPALRALDQSEWLPTGSQAPYWLSFLANWAAPINAFPSSYLGMFWTVCVEEQIYFIFPAILLLAWRPMLAVLVAMIVLGPLACYLTVRHGQPYPAVWNFTTSHLDSFGLGLLLALVDSRSVPADSAWRRVRAAVGTPIGVVLLILATGAYIAAGGSTGARFYQGYPTTWTYLAASILATGWVVIASSQRPLEWLGTRFVAWLGRRGYGLYVWHWPVLLISIQVGWLTSTGGLTPVGFTASLAATVLLAILSYRLLEVPFLRLRRRFQVVANRPD